MHEFSHGDFRMNMMCHDIMGSIKDNTANLGPVLRPEVSQAFTNLLVALKELDEVTARFMQEKGSGIA